MLNMDIHITAKCDVVSLWHLSNYREAELHISINNINIFSIDKYTINLHIFVI